MISLKRIKEIMDLLPEDVNPRLGGSCSLYLRGITNEYRDIDIIVDSIKGIELPFEKMELVHKKRLNPTLKYKVDDMAVDIIQSLVPCGKWDYNDMLGIYFETVENVLKAKEEIKKFIEENYPYENFDKNLEKAAEEYVKDEYEDGYFLPDYADEVKDAFINGAEWAKDFFKNMRKNGK